MNVLYIGASGLVGSHVAPYLSDKFSLTLTGIEAGMLGDQEILPLDITQWESTADLVQKGPGAGEKFDAIVYCATADYHHLNHADRESRRNYFEKCIDVNARGAFHVFEAAWRAEVPRVIHIGSLTAILGWPHYDYIDEQTRDRPNDLYASTKIFGENVGRSYAFPPRSRRVPPPSRFMQVICLRLGQPFHGEMHWRQSPMFPSRVPAHMEDIAFAIECALLTDIRYGIYPVVSAVDNPLIDPALYQELGYQPRWRFAPAGLVRDDVPAATLAR